MCKIKRNEVTIFQKSSASFRHYGYVKHHFKIRGVIVTKEE